MFAPISKAVRIPSYRWTDVFLRELIHDSPQDFPTRISLSFYRVPWQDMMSAT